MKKENKTKSTMNSQKDNGMCGKHGEVELWVCCKHLNNFPSKIFFSPNKQVLCNDCLDRIDDLTINDVVPVCINCLRNIAKSHFEQAIKQGKKFKDIDDILIGLENLGPIEEW